MTLVVAAMLAMLAGTVDRVAARETTGIMSDSSNLKHHTLTQRNLGEKTLLPKRGVGEVGVTMALSKYCLETCS